MPYTVRFDPNTTQQQAAVIPDATPFNDGVMTKVQAAKLAALSEGGGPPGTYGSETNGSAELDGVNTYNFVSLAGDGETYTALRDLQLVDLHVLAGIKLNTAGFRILGTGTCTIEAQGKIRHDGLGGNNGIDGGGAGPGAAYGSVGGGSAGGAGGAGGGAAGAAGAAAATGIRGGLGGVGGAGDGAGGAGGADAVPGLTEDDGATDFFPVSVLGATIGHGVLTTFQGGTGGGGGGSGAPTGEGGGGGGGGGCLVLAFAEIVNNGEISADGGNGGAGLPGADTGGGGGGGGGWASVTAGVYSGSGTITAAGGSGGAPGGVGIAGTDGVEGRVRTHFGSGSLT